MAAPEREEVICVRCPHCNLDMAPINLTDRDDWPFVLPHAAVDKESGAPVAAGVALGMPNLVLTAFECPNCRSVQLRRYRAS